MPGPETIRAPYVGLSPTDLTAHRFENLYRDYSNMPYSQALVALGLDPTVPVHEALQEAPNEELTAYQESVNSVRVGRFYARAFPVLTERLGFTFWGTGIARVAKRVESLEATPAEARSFINGVRGILEQLPVDRANPPVFTKRMNELLSAELLFEEVETPRVLSVASGTALLALALPKNLLDEEHRYRLLDIVTADPVAKDIVESQKEAQTPTQFGIFEGYDAEADPRTIPLSERTLTHAQWLEKYLKLEGEEKVLDLNPPSMKPKRQARWLTKMAERMSNRE